MSDLERLYTALSLENAAVARYQDHRSATQDPSFFALIEGLMRNEEGHEDHLEENIVRLGGDIAEVANCPGPTLPWRVEDGEQFKGQKSNLAMLRADLKFEEEATRIYSEYFSVAEDPEVKALFKEFARAEHGHVNGLKKMITAIENGTHVVKFFCPVCGWELEYSANPATGDISQCKMCGYKFALAEQDGDFVIDKA